MNCLPRVNAAPPADWSDFVKELDRWALAGRVAEFWWRDDDAVTATPQLRTLLSLAGDNPLSLAVIPASAEPSLAEAVAGSLDLTVLLHGWRHANHAAPGEKKSEYPAGRPAVDVAAELAEGIDGLRRLFAPRFQPILVPPWNRIAPEFLPLLPELGIAAVSIIARPQAPLLSGELAATDVHVDFVAWRTTRGFIGTDVALAALIGKLQAGRLTPKDYNTVTGILTHHLVMDAAAEAFLERLVPMVAAHPAAQWVGAEALLRRR